jgi:hypothetical protein
MRTVALLVLCTLALGLTVFSGRLAAEYVPDNVAQSNELFHQGKRLLAEGHVAQACEHFAESHRLAPRGGTILNLGLCHEQAGSLLIARQELLAARDRARVDGRVDREQLTNERIAAIDARVAWLTIVRPHAVPAANANLQLDGATLGLVDANGTIPVLPGEHRIRIDVIGYEPEEVRIVVQAGVWSPVSFRPLKPVHAVEVVTAPPVALAEPARGHAREPKDSPEAMQSIRVVALLIGILGVASGVGTGAWAFERKMVVNAHCNSRTKTCDPTGFEASNTGRALALASTVAFSTGAAAFGVWAFLPSGVFNRETEAPPASSAVGGISLHGTF